MNIQKGLKKESFSENVWKKAIEALGQGAPVGANNFADHCDIMYWISSF